MKLIRKVQMNKNLIATISTIDSNITIEELKQITEDIFEITLNVNDEVISENYSIWESIFTINELCYNSLNKKHNTLNAISRSRLVQQNNDGSDDIE